MSIALIAAVVANLAAFGRIRGQFQANADLTRAYIELALAHPDAAWIDPDSPLLGMPPLPELIRTVEASGSPLRDDLWPSVVRRPGAAARERALLRMIGSGFRAEPPTSEGPAGTLEVVRLDGATAARDGSCVTVTASDGTSEVDVAAPSGSRIRITPNSSAQARALLGRTAPSLPLSLGLTVGAATDVVVPDIGDGEAWTVRLELPEAAGPVSLCRV